ncbi:nucleotidyltransferase family protein [Microbacterium amylolyticum]|uniref:Molybdenum cofactor cytidylyltransferase n=1 Tax=Microbacterium amylolyticum TaxID=936337 RepID=A0ABS4ZGP5_9MICO|nr:NTP transferase domain-containing protein [Microbacterium amylolyticum]MBP2436446.1 molybdenum cofactor cytidylyltransferase [Microbacterium amylolyticum]
MRIVGLVLAGGAGTRYGMPKSLARTADGTPWLHRAVAALRDGGCSEVIVVLGARATDAGALVPHGAKVEVAGAWADGLSATIRAGLVAAGSADAVVIVPVDTPHLPARAVRRVIGEDRQMDDAGTLAGLRGSLRQAVYHGQPGHPVLIGADHLPGVLESLSGDRGAGPYLRSRGAAQVECADLWNGEDIDAAPR